MAVWERGSVFKYKNTATPHTEVYVAVRERGSVALFLYLKTLPHTEVYMAVRERGSVAVKTLPHSALYQPLFS